MATTVGVKWVNVNINLMELAHRWHGILAVLDLVIVSVGVSEGYGAWQYCWSSGVTYQETWCVWESLSYSGRKGL